MVWRREGGGCRPGPLGGELDGHVGHKPSGHSPLPWVEAAGQLLGLRRELRLLGVGCRELRGHLAVGLVHVHGALNGHISHQ